jgi:hypothetical protein
LLLYANFLSPLPLPRTVQSMTDEAMAHCARAEAAKNSKTSSSQVSSSQISSASSSLTAAQAIHQWLRDVFHAPLISYSHSTSSSSTSSLLSSPPSHAVVSVATPVKKAAGLSDPEIGV